MKTQKLRLKTFLKTAEGTRIMWLDYCGYHLAEKQSDLTPTQALLISKGRMNLYKEMNEVKDI